MGAKDWMVMYSNGDIPSILRKTPPPDRAQARAVVERLYDDHDITEIADGTLSYANPPDDVVYIGCFDELTIVCTSDVALDEPSDLPARFLREARGRRTYLHAMHSVVDWAAFAVWEADGTLRRSLSLSLDDDFDFEIENIGEPFEFEAPYWAGERREDEDDDEFPFHPLELAEDALRAFFGFNYEGLYLPEQPNLDEIVLAGFAVRF